MDFNNNPCLHPIEKDPLNLYKVLNERVNAIQKALANIGEDFNSKKINVSEELNSKKINVSEELNVDGDANLNVEGTSSLNRANINELNVENGGSLNITRLNVRNTIKNPSLTETTPIQSQYVVGYDENGTLIPIIAEASPSGEIQVPQNAQFISSDEEGKLKKLTLFDHIVNSQEKFDELMSLAQSAGGVPYKNIAIVGGFGGGVNGEYELTVTSSTSNGEFNNAKIYSYKSPIIKVTLDNVDASEVKIFDDIENIDGIEISVSGTIYEGTVVSLFSSSKISNSKITRVANAPLFYIKDCELEDVINEEHLKFQKCEFKDCDTVQSFFENCSSDCLYVSTSSYINKKWKFEGCGLHLSVRDSENSATNEVTMNILSLENTTLTCLEKGSRNKKLNLNCESCDTYSKIVGNNDNPLNYTCKPIFSTNVEVDPSAIGYAYVDYNDTSKTPVYKDSEHQPQYTNQAYIDKDFTTLASKFQIFPEDNPDNGILTYKYSSGTSEYYSNLTFADEKKILENTTPTGIQWGLLKITEGADKIIVNGSPIKTYTVRGDKSNTLVYSKDNGATYYISPSFEEDCRIKLYDIISSGKHCKVFRCGFNYGDDFWIDLSFRECVYPDVGSSLTELTIPSIEVNLKTQSEYAVQVTSANGDYINVKDAYFTKIQS